MGRLALNSPIADLAISRASGAKDIRIAAPYIKYEAMDRLLSVVPDDATVTCVTRWKPQDIAVGASDTGCRALVTARSGRFMLHPSLHAKFYSFDNAMLVGSANLTSSGMGWSPSPNLEILCKPDDGFDGDLFWDNLISESREITDAELSYWIQVERLNGQREENSWLPASSSKEWRPTTREYGNLELAFLNRWQDIPSADERTRASRDLSALALPSGSPLNEFKSWATASVLGASFTHDILRLHHLDQITASREVASLYDLSDIDARRAMETVHNWLRELAPELLPSSENQ